MAYISGKDITEVAFLPSSFFLLPSPFIVLNTAPLVP